ncbi:MAG TPA: ACT domain-containing protein [Pyrinomonadaceae bacterium]|nr:ACT domain-containing protein [Pyrinomonadaceae bacterium]
MSIEQVIRESKVHVVTGRYAVAKVKGLNSIGSHFAVCQDSTETTVITEERHLPQIEAIAIELWFRLIEIRVSQPFNAPGFLSAVSTAIAAAGVNVFIVSTFSKDYVLLREDDLDLGIQALKGVGFQTED